MDEYDPDPDPDPVDDVRDRMREPSEPDERRRREASVSDDSWGCDTCDASVLDESCALEASEPDDPDREPLSSHWTLRDGVTMLGCPRDPSLCHTRVGDDRFDDDPDVAGVELALVPVPEPSSAPDRRRSGVRPPPRLPAGASSRLCTTWPVVSTSGRRTPSRCRDVSTARVADAASHVVSLLTVRDERRLRALDLPDVDVPRAAPRAAHSSARLASCSSAAHRGMISGTSHGNSALPDTASSRTAAADASRTGATGPCT